MFGFATRTTWLICVAAAAVQGARRPRHGSTSSVITPDHCRLSLQQSNGFFCESDASWVLRRRKWACQQTRQQTSNATAGHVFWQQNWEPDFACEHEERLGSPGDGGKWVCNPARVRELYEGRTPPADKCVVYSMGSENAFDFEEGVHRALPLCELHTFDHTVAKPTPPPFVSFHRLGLGGVDGPNTASLPSIMAGLNHTFIEILKIDVEGDEYAALMPLLASTGLAFVRQLLIELHHTGPEIGNLPQFANLAATNTPTAHHTFFNAMQDAGWVIFHKEPNTQFAGGTCIEYGFVRLGWSVSEGLVNATDFREGWTK